MMPDDRRLTTDDRPVMTNDQRPTDQTDVYVGRDYGRHDFVIDTEEVAKYSGAVDDHNPIYTGASPFGGPVAPALVRHSEVYEYRAVNGGVPEWYLPNLFGNLHARQEWEFFAPVMVGDALHTRSFIADRYVKRGRDYLVNEVLYFNAGDAIVARGRTHQSFLRETKNEGIVIDEKREKQPGPEVRDGRLGRDRRDPGAEEADHARYVLEVQRAEQELPQRQRDGDQVGLPGYRRAGDDVDLLPVGDDDKSLWRRLARRWQDERQPREHRLAERPPHLPRLRPRARASPRASVSARTSTSGSKKKTARR